MRRDRKENAKGHKRKCEGTEKKSNLGARARPMSDGSEEGEPIVCLPAFADQPPAETTNRAGVSTIAGI
jgi:hypothetical protein